MSPATSELYCRQLRAYDMRDVEKAVLAMAMEPREAFQPAFPDLGTILQRVIQAREDRTARGKFQTCGQCLSGFRIFNYDDRTPHHRIRDSGRDTYAVECQCVAEWRGQTVAAGE